MALAFSKTAVPIKHAGGYRFKFVSITLDTDYPAGGWAIAATDVGLARNIAALFPNNVAGFVMRWDETNKKLMAYATGAGNGLILAEASVGENGLANLVCQALVIGD